MKRTIGLALALVTVMLGSRLDAVRSEPNFEKRSKLALDNANLAIDDARRDYSAGDIKGSRAALEEVRDSVNLGLEALNATGKSARKNPKPFKHAEVEIREMLRRLQTLELDFSVDDRGEVLKTEQRLQEVHDELISRIMSKRK